MTDSASDTRAFASQGDAKRFFVGKIVAQAASELRPLSDAQRRMLSFSESDPEFVVDPTLVETLAAEISDDDYEAKIAGLLQRAYQRDVGGDSSSRDVYRQAYATLTQGDHYLLVMIDQALGRQLRPWWAFWR